jgi:hypothetical protein
MQSLSACASDGQAMTSLLRQTGRFDDILVLTEPDETNSAVVKQRLVKFIEAHKSDTVEEIVFYFSGHGDFSGDEFYHILSDYELRARNRTTLSNSELDEMVRGLSPNLFVKIVDACYSGMNYIKSDVDLNTFLKGTNTGFKNLYFLYSSQSDQPSWTDGDLSAFTKAILSEVTRQATGPVRYRDIMSAVSDHFATAGGQTPQFIVQADSTDLFCEASPEIQTALAKFLPKLSAPPSSVPGNPSAPKKGLSLAERISAAQADYCTQDETIAVFESFRSALEAAKPTSELGELFDYHVIAGDEPSDNAEQVGEWLKKNSNRHFYARVQTITRVVRRQVPKRDSIWSNRLLLGRNSRMEPEFIEVKEEDIVGYVNTAKLPFQRVTLKLSPKMKLVAPVECDVALVASATSMRVFYRLKNFVPSDWDSFVPSKAKTGWDSEETKLKDGARVTAIAEVIVSNFFEMSTSHLLALWPDIRPLNLDKSKVKLTK